MSDPPDTALRIMGPPRRRGQDDAADEYAIEERADAADGLVIYARYHGRWHANPWSTRGLVKVLLERIRAAEAKRAAEACEQSE